MPAELSAQTVFDHLNRVRGVAIGSCPDPAFPHEAVIPFATYAPWRGDAAFQRTLQRIGKHTLVDFYRCYELWQLLPQLVTVPGDILEVGVWRGGTGCLLALRAQETTPEKAIFLCDTFVGVVKAGVHDTLYRGGEHKDTSRAIVEELLADAGVTNATVLQGIFPEETGDAIAARRFAFCHIDVDVYQSARDVLDWVWPRLSIGGAVVFDDFGFVGCEGVMRLLAERQLVPGTLVLHNLNGHAIIVRTA